MILIALGAGALAPLQGTNAELLKYWQQPIWSTVWVYLSGLAGILLIQAFARQTFPASSIGLPFRGSWWVADGRGRLAGVQVLITTRKRLL